MSKKRDLSPAGVELNNLLTPVVNPQGGGSSQISFTYFGDSVPGNFIFVGDNFDFSTNPNDNNQIIINRLDTGGNSLGTETLIFDSVNLIVTQPQQTQSPESSTQSPNTDSPVTGQPAVPQSLTDAPVPPTSQVPSIAPSGVPIKAPTSQAPTSQAPTSQAPTSKTPTSQSPTQGGDPIGDIYTLFVTKGDNGEYGVTLESDEGAEVCADTIERSEIDAVRQNQTMDNSEFTYNPKNGLFNFSDPNCTYGGAVLPTNPENPGFMPIQLNAMDRGNGAINGSTIFMVPLDALDITSSPTSGGTPPGDTPPDNTALIVGGAVIGLVTLLLLLRGAKYLLGTTPVVEGGATQIQRGAFEEINHNAEQQDAEQGGTRGRSLSLVARQEQEAATRLDGKDQNTRSGSRD
jgi:hypothetical protein